MKIASFIFVFILLFAPAGYCIDTLEIIGERVSENYLSGDNNYGPVAIVVVMFNEVQLFFNGPIYLKATGSSGWLAEIVSIGSASKISGKPIVSTENSSGSIIAIKLQD